MSILELVIKDRLNRLKMIFNHKTIRKINKEEQHIFKDNKKEIIEILENKRYSATLRFRK